MNDDTIGAMRDRSSEKASSSGFAGVGASGFGDDGRGAGASIGVASIAAGGPAASVASPFDVCHGGVVLRVVCFVQASVAIGVAFTAAGPAAWLASFALASLVSLTGLCVWLAAACLSRPMLQRRSGSAQWAAAVVLGAVGGAVGWALLWLSGLSAPASPGAGGGPAWLGAGASLLAGAAFAGVVFLWLGLRAQARAPADQAARLAELQSRIRPHFLFNTLNTAIALAAVDPARAEGVLEDLAELFRVALDDGGEAATLADEVDLAKRYLAIEQLRFGDRLRVSWDLDPAAGAARVPPLLLQPLVENAVRHGVEPADDGGLIRVRTRVRRGEVLVSIDNSVPAGRARPGHGMALRNVQERLHLMHDVSSRFQSRLDGDVWRVEIALPL